MSSDLYGRTRRLELADQNLRSFEAVVLASSPDGIVLSTSAFYPGGGGQPADRGVLLWQGVETRSGLVSRGVEYCHPLMRHGIPLPTDGSAVGAEVGFV
jgi:misacylated tRNA(Ala) deacylase